MVSFFSAELTQDQERPDDTVKIVLRHTSIFVYWRYGGHVQT